MGLIRLKSGIWLTGRIYERSLFKRNHKNSPLQLASACRGAFSLLPYLCYDTNTYHFILRFCKTKKDAHRVARSAEWRKKFTIFAV